MSNSFVEIARARGVAAFLRGAELLQMQIADAGLVETGGQLPLGEAGAARGRDRARVDDEADAGALEFVDDGGGPRLLVADGEERHRRSPFARLRSSASPTRERPKQPSQ